MNTTFFHGPHSRNALIARLPGSFGCLPASGCELAAPEGGQVKRGIDGELVQWCGSYGAGWGLIFDYEHGGDAPGVETRRSARFLRGLVGYTGDANQSTLHLLWLPIPIW